MKSLILLTIISFLIFTPVYAQGDRPGGLADPDGCVNCEIDENVGLEELRIPIFNNFIDFNTNNASIFSWISFAGALATVGLVIFWIFLLIRAGVKGMQSQGNQEGIAESFKQVQSILLGAGISLAFPIVLSLIGLLLGIGTIFSWPKMFQFCTESSGFQFYYQALLDSSLPESANGNQDVADTNCAPIGN